MNPTGPRSDLAAVYHTTLAALLHGHSSQEVCSAFGDGEFLCPQTLPSPQTSMLTQHAKAWDAYMRARTDVSRMFPLPVAPGQAPGPPGMHMNGLVPGPHPGVHGRDGTTPSHPGPTRRPPASRSTSELTPDSLPMSPGFRSRHSSVHGPHGRFPPVVSGSESSRAGASIQQPNFGFGIPEGNNPRTHARLFLSQPLFPKPSCFTIDCMYVANQTTQLSAVNFVPIAPKIKVEPLEDSEDEKLSAAAGKRLKKMDFEDAPAPKRRLGRPRLSEKTLG